MMGAIKTKLNKVSSNAFQKVTGKLKRQQLHDCRSLQSTATTTTTPQEQQQEQQEQDQSQFEKAAAAEAAASVMMLHPPPPAGSADPRIPPDYKLNQSLVTTQFIPTDQPSPGQLIQPDPLRSAPATAASASSWTSHGSQSSSPGSAMSVEYTLTSTPMVQSGGTDTTPIDLTASSPYCGNSPTNPIDLTGSSASPTTAGAAMSAINAASARCNDDSPLPATWDYMIIDDFETPSDLENKICDEDELMDHHIRQVQSDQMRKDEAMARELQARLDRDARIGKEPSAFHSTHNQGSFGFAGGPAALFLDDQDENAIRAHGQAVLEIRCPKCKVPLVEDSKDIITQTIAHVDSGTMCSHLTCSACETSICLSCNTSGSRATLSNSGMLLSTSPEERAAVSTCCATARVNMVWLLSCGIQVPLSQPSPSRSRTLRNSIKGRIGGSSTENKKPDPPKSVMNAITSATTSTGKTAYSKGVGYGGEDVYPAAHNHFRGSSAKIAQIPPKGEQLSPENQKLAAYFRALAIVLPSLERSSPFDIQPDSLIARFIRRSPLLPKAAELLRNDSIDDMLAKEELYRAVLSFVQALAGHIITARLVHSSLIMYATEGQTFALSVNSNGSTGKGKTKAAEKTSSLASIVSKLANICRRITQRASAHLDEFMVDDGPRMISLCHSIVDLDNFLTANRFEADHLEVTASRVTRLAAAQSSAEMAEKKAREYREWHQRNCLADVLDDELWKNYYFASTAGQLVSSQKGRMKRLITETTNLASSLPEGIFVRHASSRLDTMKVMIIGPVGTPYENGLFEFDLFCPDSYPYAPPSMQFKTTGGGLVRFNPNLYEDGKVCLSLLGTWQGPAWNPSNSTILQVLVSIQSMVFCDKPWYNEPGRERQPSESASDNYNRGIHEWTVQHAMLKWLTSTSGCLPQAGPTTSSNNVPPPGNGQSTATVNRSDEYIWGDVVRKHFMTNAKAIGETVKKWKAKGLKNSKIGSLATELNTAMITKGFLP